MTDLWPVLALIIVLVVPYRRGASKLPVTRPVPRDHGYRPNDIVTLNGKDFIVLLTSDTTITVGRCRR